jgi:hypothetical protein
MFLLKAVLKTRHGCSRVCKSGIFPEGDVGSEPDLNFEAGVPLHAPHDRNCTEERPSRHP